MGRVDSLMCIKIFTHWTYISEKKIRDIFLKQMNMRLVLGGKRK